MLSRFLIYGLADPRNGQLRYVGKSTSGLLRPRSHASPSNLRRSGNRHSANWIRQLQGLGLKYEVVIIEETQEKAGLAEQEKFWIAYFRFVGCDLTNATAGGEGAVGYRHTVESRAKISAVHKGKKKGNVSAETRRNMAVAQQSRSPETRARISAAKKGHTVSTETRARIAMANKGKEPSQEARAKMATAQRIRWSLKRQGLAAPSTARSNI